MSRYRALVGPLRARPLPVGNRVLDAGDADTGTIAGLYRQSDWPLLRGALTELASGDGSGLLRLADTLEGRDGQGHYDGLQDAFLAISCADDTRIASRARYDLLDVRSRELAAFRDDGRGTGRGPIGVCETWPPAARHDDADTGTATTGTTTTGTATTTDTARSVPVLVIATTGDPATPFATATRVAQRLGAGVVTVDGYTHTASFQGDRCVDDAVNHFLAGHPTTPTANLTC